MGDSKLFQSRHGICRNSLCYWREMPLGSRPEKRQRARENRTEVAKPISTEQRRTELWKQKGLKHESLKLQFNKFSLGVMVLFATVLLLPADKPVYFRSEKVANHYLITNCSEYPSRMAHRAVGWWVSTVAKLYYSWDESSFSAIEIHCLLTLTTITLSELQQCLH